MTTHNYKHVRQSKENSHVITVYSKKMKTYIYLSFSQGKTFADSKYDHAAEIAQIQILTDCRLPLYPRGRVVRSASTTVDGCASGGDGRRKGRTQTLSCRRAYCRRGCGSIDIAPAPPGGSGEKRRRNM